MNIKRRRCSNEKSPSELLLIKPFRYWPSEIQMTSEKQITQDQLREELATKISTPLKAEIKEELEITKLQTQMKATLNELEDPRTRTVRLTLILKNIPGNQNESWEDTLQASG